MQLGSVDSDRLNPIMPASSSAYYAPFPFKVTWDVTYRCNLRCNHCFVIYQKNANFKHPRREDALRIADSIVAARPFFVSIAGGEPFILEYMPEILAKFSDADIDVIVATNGLFKEGLLSAIDANRVSLQVSLDGPNSDFHDRIRGTGTFRTTVNTIRVAASRLNITVATTLTSHVCEHLDELLDFVCGLNVKAIKLQKFIAAPSVPDRSLAPSAKQLAQAESSLRSIPGTVGQLVVMHPFDPIGFDREHSSQIRLAACEGGVGRTECTITPEGNVVMCGAMLDDSRSYGNVQSEDLRDIWGRIVTQSSCGGHRCLCNSTLAI
ncbi:radical SAM protein [Mesorhizobium sp.]|uniref:radical SAM/SPASM domain-containing protein n=1 Tax=Mesorhizobium sp. TaxID=1871066 RepID=UPI000FE7A972|nr:radical SAM protein [Mesorhizobium sp.]RWQ20552.1 MAG: radical SAM protein [Mesorhizobium sp.]